MTQVPPRYSLVLPVFNEIETIPRLKPELEKLLSKLDGSAEVIFINDGSTDGSREALNALAAQDAKFKVLHFSRNFGHQAAITAGLDHSLGDATIIMDADLQDPPEVVLAMAAKWKEGYDIVYAVRSEREGESFFKLLTAKYFYRLLDCLTETKIPVDVGDFRLVSRQAVDAFKKMRESNRYVRGMFSWIGFKQIGIPYRRESRKAGETKFPLTKMLKFAKDGILSFSNLPLRMAMNFGLVVSLVSFAAGVYSVYLKLSGSYVVPGWTSLALVITFIGGIQLMVLGIIGEYIGRIYEEVKNRPLYLIDDRH